MRRKQKSCLRSADAEAGSGKAEDVEREQRAALLPPRGGTLGDSSSPDESSGAREEVRRTVLADCLRSSTSLEQRN